MTHVEFDKLVKRVEKEAASRLWLYELKLRILALLGYGYITGILTTILVLLLLMWSLLLFVPELNVTASRVAFGLVSACVLFRLARIFLIRFPPPGGMEVYPEQLPQLFEMVDRLQEEFRSPPVHHIVLTPEFNAAMMYRPRIGPFRKSRNYLILGLPLFFGLSQPEFTAVVAHELGHLSYEHGKFGAYIYRIRERWYRLMESFGQRKGGIGALFTWFFSWCAPYFGAYSFVEVRQREYEADRGAADVTHPNWAASALCRVSVIGRYVHEVFWPSIEEESYKSPEVTVLPFKSMSRKLPDGPGYTIAQGLTHECLLEDAGTTDTHPSLNERLRALEVEPSTDYLPIKPAANVFLGQLKSPLVEEFDRWWQESLAETWKNSFESRNSREEALKELEEKARGDNPFTSNDRWNYASLVEEFHGGEAALPHFEAIMDVNPLDAEAELCIGRILLVEQPAEGIQRLEKIIDEHVELAPEAATLLYTHFAKLGEKEAAERFRKQSLSSLDNHEEALAAESDPFDPQQYIEHGLLPDKISQLGSLFSRSEAIKAVYLVRKKKRQFGRPSVFVVGLSFHRFKGRESKVDEAVGLLLLEFELPGPFEVAPMIKDLTNLQKTFQQIPDSLIFQSR